MSVTVLSDPSEGRSCRRCLRCATDTTGSRRGPTRSSSPEHETQGKCGNESVVPAACRTHPVQHQSDGCERAGWRLRNIATAPGLTSDEPRRSSIRGATPTRSGVFPGPANSAGGRHDVGSRGRPRRARVGPSVGGRCRGRLSTSGSISSQDQDAGPAPETTAGSPDRAQAVEQFGGVAAWRPRGTAGAAGLRWPPSGLAGAPVRAASSRADRPAANAASACGTVAGSTPRAFFVEAENGGTSATGRIDGSQSTRNAWARPSSSNQATLSPPSIHGCCGDPEICSGGPYHPVSLSRAARVPSHG